LRASLTVLAGSGKQTGMVGIVRVNGSRLIESVPNRASKCQRGLAASLLLTLSLSVEAAQSQFIITPSPGNLDGNSFLTPFNTSQSGRFQQVYDASLFSSLPPGGGSIYYIFFRVDPFLGQSFSAGISNLQINLSTTTRGVDGLSSSFDQNTGANDTVALGPRPVGIGGAGGGGFSGFTVSFTLDHPFYYDPAMGNLLLDFRIYAGAPNMPGGIAWLDAFDVAGDGVSSVSAYGSSLPGVGQVSTLGLATEFSIAAVPEPSTLALLATGLGTAFLRWRKNKPRKEARHVAP
jgi:hypothetical protein